MRHPEASPRVSIVILSYARPEMLAESLRAALAQSFASREIVVVDNESARSDEIAALVARYEGVRHVRTGANLGFAAGMNAGLREAHGALVLLTEDDMVLDPHAVEHFVRADAASSSPGLYSGLIRDRDTGTVWYAGGELSLSSVFSLRLMHRGDVDLRLPMILETDYLTGALIFGRTSLLRDVGGFRDDFFMYSEDVELCLRARRRGIALHVVTGAMAVHFTPGSGNPSAILEYHKRKNLLATYLLHGAPRALPSALARYGVMDLIRVVRSGQSLVPHLRALGWVALNVPRLMYDRLALRRG